MVPTIFAKSEGQFQVFESFATYKKEFLQKIFEPLFDKVCTYKILRASGPQVLLDGRVGSIGLQPAKVTFFHLQVLN